MLALIDFRWFSKFVDPSHRDSISPVSARAVAREQTKLSEEYSLLKDEMKARLLKALVDVYPQVEKHISLADLSTPVTMNRFIGTTRGEFNGLHHGSNRFSARTQRMLRPQMPITGLYLTGQDITSPLFEVKAGGHRHAVSWLVFFQCFSVLGKTDFCCLAPGVEKAAGRRRNRRQHRQQSAMQNTGAERRQTGFGSAEIAFASNKRCAFVVDCNARNTPDTCVLVALFPINCSAKFLTFYGVFDPSRPKSALSQKAPVPTAGLIYPFFALAV